MSGYHARQEVAANRHHDESHGARQGEGPTAGLLVHGAFVIRRDPPHPTPPHVTFGLEPGDVSHVLGTHSLAGNLVTCPFFYFYGSHVAHPGLAEPCAMFEHRYWRSDWTAALSFGEGRRQQCWQSGCGAEPIDIQRKAVTLRRVVRRREVRKVRVYWRNCESL